MPRGVTNCFDRHHIFSTRARVVDRAWPLRLMGTTRGLARDLLAPIYGWFTEGFDTRDLRGEGGALMLAAGEGS